MTGNVCMNVTLTRARLLTVEKSITYSECVSTALIILHATRMRHL
jgi:hypothetical protein